MELSGVGRGALRDLAEGRFDGLVAPASLVAEGTRAVPLGASGWRVFGRADHPTFAEEGGWSLERWLRWPHLRIRTRGDGEGPVDLALRAAGASRRVGAAVPTFTAAPAVLAETDLLLTVPEIAVGRAAARYGLASRPPPLEIPAMQMALHRSAIAGDEAGAAWFLGHAERALRAALG